METKEGSFKIPLGTRKLSHGVYGGKLVGCRKFYVVGRCISDGGVNINSEKSSINSEMEAQHNRMIEACN